MSEDNADKVTDAAAAAIDKQGEAAEAAAGAAQAETARHTAEAAQAATTAAQAAATLAETHAATTIQDNEENLEWLRQHATQTDTSLKELNSRLESQPAAFQSMLEQHHSKMMESLTPLLTPPKQLESEIPVVDAAQDDPKEPAKKKAKPKKHWL